MGTYPHYRITCELEHNGTIYLAWLCPYYELTETDLRVYRIKHFSYLVHLFSPTDGFKSFEMYPDEKSLSWTTDASALLINKEIVSLLNYVLVKTLS